MIIKVTYFCSFTTVQVLTVIKHLASRRVYFERAKYKSIFFSLFREWILSDHHMSNRRDETIPLNVDENKNAILPEKNGLSGSQNSVGTWAEWDKDSVYLFS